MGLIWEKHKNIDNRPELSSTRESLVTPKCIHSTQVHSRPANLQTKTGNEHNKRIALWLCRANPAEYSGMQKEGAEVKENQKDIREPLFLAILCICRAIKGSKAKQQKDVIM
jgi:hypothetical protein